MLGTALTGTRFYRMRTFVSVAANLWCIPNRALGRHRSLRRLKLGLYSSLASVVKLLEQHK
jgi:hypothetical protein